tara:strand:- start:6657 stop:8516 length:1860 start_codon:yes stop_codon:yes gene_type:complete
MNNIDIDARIIENTHKRNYATDLIPTLNIPQKEIDKRIEYYYSIPQPPQKSQAWLDQRTNYITASSFGHALASKWSSHRNELMKNKVSNGNYNTFKGNEATRWGEKYEDVCCAIYCYRNDVTVYEFGLIPSTKYPFLGASTDGITSKLINLEIKSPFSRKIKPGSVKPIYWQQMQLQMDVLDLNLSHFLECSFHEYPSEKDFWMDFDYEDLEHPEKGIVVEIVNKDVMNNGGEPKTMYIYSPIELCLNANQLRVWHKQQISNIISSREQVYIRSHFWILAAYSCVNVARDREWFNNQVPKFIEFWEEVQRYRKNGGLEVLQKDIEKNRPKPKRIKVESDSSKFDKYPNSLSFNGDGIDDDLPGGYILSSSDEEIVDDKKDGHKQGKLVTDNSGGGCLMDSSSEEEEPPGDFEDEPDVNEPYNKVETEECKGHNLDLATERLKLIEENLSKIPDDRSKKTLNLKLRSNTSSSENSNYSNSTATYSSSSSLSTKFTSSSSATSTSYIDSSDDDSDPEDTEESIFRPDPNSRSIGDISNFSNEDSHSYFYKDDSDDEQDTMPIRPTVKQPKAFRRYKTKTQANKKRIKTRESRKSRTHSKKFTSLSRSHKNETRKHRVSLNL